jgi:hypothetical protein
MVRFAAGISFRGLQKQISGFRRHLVGDLGYLAQITMGYAFKSPVGVCHPPVLPQMLGPRFDKKRFDKSTGGGILK